MSFWVDSYRPKTLDALTYHNDLTNRLKNLSTSGDFPHLLFYGPSGAGKKTRIMAFLKGVYGNGVEKLKIDMKSFQTPSGKKLEINVISSNYHIELNPSDVGMHDRVVVQEVIKDIAQTQQIGLVEGKSNRNFKVVILNEADSLSVDAQHALRRTMEKYIKNLRIILCCNSISKIIAPIRSRCLLLCIPAPSTADMIDVMERVAKYEKFFLPQDFAKRICLKSERNLRSALLMLESEKMRSFPFSPDQQVHGHDWQEFIGHLADSILQEQSPRRLRELRLKVYELLTHCIPANVILKTLANDLVSRLPKSVDELVKLQICNQAAVYEHRLQQGTKAIYHIEAYIAKIMSLYKLFQSNVTEILF